MNVVNIILKDIEEIMQKSNITKSFNVSII